MLHTCSFALLSLFVSLLTKNADGQLSVTVESPTNPIKRGSENQLTCNYLGLNGNTANLISWGFSVTQFYEDAVGIVSYNAIRDTFNYNDSFGGSYVMTKPTGNANQASVTLTATDVTLNDIGSFWCTVSVAAFVERDFLTIDVYAPPHDTVISVTSSFITGDSVEVIEGKSYAFNCETTEVRPEASFTWILASDEQTSSNQTNTPNTNDDRLTDCKNMLNIVSSFNDNHGDKLSCNAIVQPAPADQATTHVFLDVLVPPTSGAVLMSDLSGILAEGSNVTVYERQRHTFTCEVKGTRPAATFEWDPVKNDFEIGEPVGPTAGDSLVDSSQTLTITYPDTSHHGVNLKCKANIDTTESLQPVIRSVVIHVYGPPGVPTFIGNTKDMTEGITEGLQCRANNGFPAGDLEWYINDQEITDKDVVNRVNNDDRYDIISNITFTPTREQNGNKLKCKVTHETVPPGEEESVEEVINVKYGPGEVVITQSSPNPIIENNSVTLRCTSDANPDAQTFIWFKDHANIGHNAETLDFTSIKRNDEAEYACEASNGIGNDGVSEPISVIVNYPPENVKATKSVDGPLTEGSKLILTCSSGGKPTPFQFYWYQNDVRLPNPDSNQLVLENIRKEHAGYYKCEAGNGVLQDIMSEEISVVVHYSPEITSEKKIYSIDEGDVARLECIGISHPELTFAWYSEEGPIQSGGKILITETILGHGDINGTMTISVLEIDDVSRVDGDYGIYVCNASNVVGYDTQNIDLAGITKPYNPENVNIVTEESETTSLTVSWTKGHNGGIHQWFVVQYMREETNEEMYSGTLQETSKETYQHVVTDLISSVPYYVIVISGNTLGNNTSNDSPRARGITLPLSPKQLGITMEYDRNSKTLSVSNLPEYSDESHCLQLQLNEGEGWSDWSCVFTNEALLQVPDGVDSIRGMYCVENVVCGELTNANGTSEEIPARQNGLIIGAVVGVIVLVLIIVVLIAYLLLTSNSKNTKKDSEAENGTLELQLSNGETAGISNAGMKTGEVPVYAKVNKDKNVPVYAKVNKDKNVPVYAKVNKDKNEEDAYDDVANTAKGVDINDSKEDSADGRATNPEGLIYQTVAHFKSHPKDAPPIQTEASTEYAELDFIRMKSGNK